MARPADWSPLTDSDPVPGDPAGISTAAAHLAGVADQIAGQVAMLRKIAASQSEEVGQHAAKLRSAAADTAGQLDKVTGRYRETAAALTAWVPELEHAQVQSLKALAQAQDAATRQHANKPVQRPPGTHLTPADHHADQARSNALNQANAALAAAQSMLGDATAQRDAAATQAAARIENAASKDADHWYESLWADFKSFADRYAWLIKDVCTVLEWVATALAVIALFIPGLDLLVALGIILTGIALAGRAMMAVTGNGSWLDVAMDGVALATFGWGRVLGKALKGGAGVARAAAEMEGKAQLLKEAEPTLTAFRNFITHDGSAELSKFARAGVQEVYRSVAAGAKLPAFEELGQGGLKTAFTGQNIAAGLKTALPRIVAGGDEGARASARTLSYVGEHFPHVDMGEMGKLMVKSRVNFGFAQLPAVHGGLAGFEIDTPDGSSPVSWHPSQFYATQIDGGWTTVKGGF